MKRYIKTILREGLLLSERFDKAKDVEYQNIKPVRVKNVKTYVTYHFNLGGYEYYVDVFTTKKNGMPKGTYEVLFGFKGQKGSDDVVNLGLGHIKSVLYTVGKIMDKECKEKKIKFYFFEGFPTQEELQLGKVDSTKRSRVYNMFFKEYYNESSIIIRGRYTTILMKEIYPEYFETPTGNERKDHHLLGQLLKFINNGNPSFNVWNEIVVDGDQYDIETDEIVNNSYGRLAIEVYADETESEYSISYNKLDVGEQKSEEFDDFISLFTFMQENLIGKNGQLHKEVS